MDYVCCYNLHILFEGIHPTYLNSKLKAEGMIFIFMFYLHIQNVLFFILITVYHTQLTRIIFNKFMVGKKLL